MDLRDFLAQLENKGQLRRIQAEVDPYLEMAAIADRMSKHPDGGSALLFQRPLGQTIPVLMNAFGSKKRMELALGVDQEARGLDSIADRIQKLVQELMPQPGAGWLERLGKLPMLAEMSQWMPKKVKRAPCQEVVWKGKDLDLARLPILTTWPQDAAPFITMGISHTRSKEGQRNAGLYRLQVHDAQTLGFHAQLHHDGERNRQGYAPGERMPVAVSLGGDPALLYAASAPLPPFISEVLFTGFLRKQGLEMVPCLTQDLEVPADSEIVLEGWVDPAEQRLEGPFGDHTGYYSLAAAYPVLHLSAITCRKEPIFSATVVGKAPMEDAFLGLATERIFLPLLRMVVPEIQDLHLPPAGAFHNLAILSTRKTYPGQAQKLMHAIWGLGQMMFTKCIVVVDGDVDPHDLQEVLFHITANVDPRRDLLLTEGPLDVLDHSSDRFAFGSKVGIDATRKGPMDGFLRSWPEDLKMREDILERIDRRWQEYGL